MFGLTQNLILGMAIGVGVSLLTSVVQIFIINSLAEDLVSGTKGHAVEGSMVMATNMPQTVLYWMALRIKAYLSP